jgi:ElaB/YqjD/DUF883 family membrane-anchored ribosome-binding protein
MDQARPSKEIYMPDPTNLGYPNDTFGDSLAEGSKNLKESITDTANKATEKSKELGRTAMNKIEESRTSVASSLQSAATTLHQKADSGVQAAGNVAHSAADKLEAVAGYMRDNDTKKMMADVEEVVKKNPGRSLLVAVAVGFLAGRALRNS